METGTSPEPAKANTTALADASNMLIQAPLEAKLAQTRQNLRAANSEIEELRQSLRYVEISLAKQREEKEKLEGTLNKSLKDQETIEDTLKARDKEISEQQFQITQLNKKISNFNKNQDKIAAKNTFKANTYMTEINDKENEVIQMRDKMVDCEEDMKSLTLTREKFRLERDYLMSEMKIQERAFKDLQQKFEDQTRLLQNVVTHNKNHGDTLKSLPDISTQDAGGSGGGPDRARMEAQRSERIAKTMNRSSFMGLGENPPKLYSEQDPALVKHVTIEDRGFDNKLDDPFYDKNSSYLSDDSVPTQIYGCIDKFREKARRTTPGNQLAMLIDDFFGEAHAIMKDSHLREIARIRNENSVEIMRLKKTISDRGSSSSIGSQEHHAAFKTAVSKLPQTSFADNEVERQRRLLIEENQTLKQRLGAVQNILRSGTNERVKFMEGASWVATKSQTEADRIATKLVQIAKEFVHRTKSAVRDPHLKDYEGTRIEENTHWLNGQLVRQADEATTCYKHLFENVNYFLSDAQRSLNGAGQN